MLSLDLLFSEFAVLQREKEIAVWGTGEDGKEVTVSIQGNSAVATVENGKWEAVLPPLKASESEKMTVSDGTDTVIVSNVAVGEVWIAGGQSNMEFPLRNLREYGSISDTNIPLIRLYGVPRISYEGQLEDDDFSEYRIWRKCTPENLWFYSAAPFYFAIKLFEKYRVPIGILNCNYGGTRAIAWAEKSIVEKTAAKIWIDEYEESIKDLDMDEYTKSFKANPMNKTANSDHSKMRDKMWKGYSRLELFLKQRSMKKFFEKMPLPKMGPLDPNSPSALYNNMLKTIVPYGVQGVIWYQGESDENHADIYDVAMETVVDSWRRLWNEDIPFLMVQLAPYEGWLGMMAKDYMVLRAKQEKLSKTKNNVYITNVMDSGMRSDIHPKKKKQVGERLALLAMGKVYGDDILCEAPEVSSYEKSGSKVTVKFINCGEGLERRKRDIESLDVTVDGNEIKGCKIRLDKECMVINKAEFENAKNITVKYGMKNYCECNIKNSADIPVKPFEIKING